MGIKDLLRFIKPYVEPIHIKKYAGKRVGIDAYSWLHKGAYSCSMELCLDTDGEKKLQYINYCMHRLNLLRHNKITPVVVFDGGSIPCKGATAQERYRKRKANHDLAMVKLNEGNITAAIELFQRAVSVTPSMAHQLIQVLRSEEIEFIVAPYEADAQLAYLTTLEVNKGGIEAVISEDSDLLTYGCPAIIFKMDKFGNGEEIVLDKVLNSDSCTPSFRNFDKELFTGMCVLAGCDFLASVPGIGITKAYNLVSKYRNLDRALSMLKFDKGSQMPEDYFTSFKKAITVFRHARIYDAETKQLKHMKPIPEELLLSFGEELDFLGPHIPPSIATAIAEGKLNPCTMEAYPSTVSNFKITTRPQNHIKREKDTIPSSNESGFSVISSRRSKKVEISVMEKANIEEDQKTFCFEESKYKDEAITLQKLVSPLKSEITEESKPVVIKKEVLKVPDNNPFRKRKVEEINVVSTESEDCEQVSEVTIKVETEEISCVTPDSQRSVNSKALKIMSEKNGSTKKKVKKEKKDDSKTVKGISLLNFFSRV